MTGKDPGTIRLEGHPEASTNERQKLLSSLIGGDRFSEVVLHLGKMATSINSYIKPESSTNIKHTNLFITVKVIKNE